MLPHAAVHPCRLVPLRSFDWRALLRPLRRSDLLHSTLAQQATLKPKAQLSAANSDMAGHKRKQAGQQPADEPTAALHPSGRPKRQVRQVMTSFADLDSGEEADSVSSDSGSESEEAELPIPKLSEEDASTFVLTALSTGPLAGLDRVTSEQVGTGKGAWAVVY